MYECVVVQLKKGGCMSVVVQLKKGGCMCVVVQLKKGRYECGCVAEEGWVYVSVVVQLRRVGVCVFGCAAEGGWGVSLSSRNSTSLSRMPVGVSCAGVISSPLTSCCSGSSSSSNRSIRRGGGGLQGKAMSGGMHALQY
jgi:hypothetical protein